MNGETYGLTLRGGNAISLSSLVQALHIADDSTYADAGGTGGSEDSIDGEDEEPVASTDVDEVTRDDLAVSWKTRKFIAAVQSVEFSSPELVWVGKIEEDTTVGQVMDANQLLPVYSPGTTDNEFCRMFYRSVAAPDWVLISLKPFSTEESLTITMKDGAQLVVRVTDAADAVLISDGNGGEIVQTITNPAGTTIDLFDYWITDALRDAHGMNGWPGHKDQDQPYDSWSFAAYNYWGGEINGGNTPRGEMDTDINDYYIVNDQLRGNGNESGINKGHLFKFYPGAAGTVVDRGDKKNGRNDHIRGSYNEWTNNHDKYSSINSWTGTADPTQGLIEKTLVDGYPRLVGGNAGYHLGTVDSTSTANGESLAYLFDNTALDGKQKYGNVNNLLYVDPEGYYTYDSRYYSAEYNKEGAAQGTFTLREHDIKGDTKHENAIKGFWPFGDRINWHGLHMTAQFSMPANGQVLNPRGEYKDMQFEFSGDDDTWLFIDGVLVGDGGGIHNRTEIDVNFATGNVTVTGRKDDNHMGQFEEVKWLDDIFKGRLF